jgi:adenylate cyclase
MSDVFISYSHENRSTARLYAQALEGQGLSVWWDDALRSGEAFDEKIEQALRAAKAVVVLWSKHSVASRWVRAEATQADRNRTLVPVMIEPCERPIMFELTHTTDLGHWSGALNDAAWLGFLADVQRCVAARVTPAQPMSAAAPAVAESGPAGSSPARPAILILPFVNMSGDVEQEYFSDGVTEDIITDLGRVSALSVISRNAAFALKGKTVAAAQLGREHRVSHILEGSIRKSGNRVRITAQLVEAATDAQVWAERFDRTLDDIFAIQDEISQAIVAALKVRLAPEEKRAIEHRATSNGEAYELFVMAREFSRSGSQRVQPLIVRLCERAVELDPGFARAWAQMAFALAELHQRNLGGAPGETGRAAAERAIALDPDMAEAHAAMSEVLGRTAGVDVLAGLPYAEAALRIDPDCYEANLFIGYLYLGERRFEDAVRVYEKAGVLDLRAVRPLGMVCQAYKGLGDVDGGRDAARRTITRCEAVLALEPDHSEAIGFMVCALANLGEGARAIEWARRALLFDPDNGRLHYNLACALAELGDVDAAVDLLERVAPTVNAAWLAWIERDNSLDPIRAAPRFIAFLEAALRARTPAS